MRISILLSFLFLFSITELHAGAAEKWEYEPVMKNMNIEVKAHKVDQYGAAVNDYEYNTKIDPKTSVNRTNMGRVGFGRLLRISGWGLLGYEALSGLLKAVDWVLDPEAQSIWRYKIDESGGLSSCIYYDYPDSPSRKVQLFYDYNFQSQTISRCPLTAAQSFAREWSKLHGYQVEFTRWVDNTQLEKFATMGTKIYPVLYFVVTYTYSDGSHEEKTFALNIKPDPNQNIPERPKEYLTPDELADYANHTHPDYSNPDLAPKLEPKYSPEIASDLWKPSNPWEETNSPTVQEVTRQLEQSQPVPKTDPEITPNPETGSWKLPPFCEIAAPVCEFIKWVKEPPESLESIDVPEKEIDKQEIKKDLVTLNVRSCPADIRFDVQNLPFGIQVNKGVQMQPICDTIEPLKYVFQLMTFVFCGFILLRV